MTPFNYYGSKRSLFKWILSHFPADYKKLHYIEPYFGAGTLFFQKLPSQLETINDIDPAIVTFYKVLKNQPKELIKRIDEILITEKVYKDYQKILNSKDIKSEIEKAISVFIVYNLSFGGNYKYKYVLEIKGNSKKKEGILNKLRLLSLLSRRLYKTQILDKSALKLIKNFDTEKSFFYLDPPYPEAHQYSYKFKFSRRDFENLLTVLKTLKGKFLLSCYKKDWMRFDPKWTTDYKDTYSYRNMVNRTAKPKKECLIKNY